MRVVIRFFSLLFIACTFAACTTSTTLQKDCVVTDGSACDSGTPPVRPPECPASADSFGEPCAVEGLECEYGQECCCGRCAASTILYCDGESWLGYATDFCFIPSCDGTPCEDGSGCEHHGTSVTVCVDGTCRPPAACREIGERERCVATDGCVFHEPGCMDGPSALGGCFPASGCDEAGACPGDLECRTISVNPCAGEISCGACAVDVQVCMEP